MDAIDALLGRTSAAALTDPAPDPETLATALQAAAAAPDHGRLRPWRFVLISGEERQRFGDVLAEALVRREPASTEADLQKERARALRAPMIIVAAASVVAKHGKVPEIEQIVAVGAAVQNLLLALHAKGYGTMWKTGPAAYDAGVRERLGLAEGELVIGFLYVGTRVGGPVNPRRGDYREVTRTWEASQFHPIT